MRNLKMLLGVFMIAMITPIVFGGRSDAAAKQHTVKKGDTYIKIARKHQINDWRTIRKVNNKRGILILVGEKLVVPSKSSKTSSSRGWRANPKNCNTNTQWIAAESPHYCINKPGQVKAATTAKKSVKKSSKTTKAPVVSRGGCSLAYNYNNWNQKVAYAVCMAESSGNQYAYNPEGHRGCRGSRGLFQIACIHGAKSTFDAAANVAAANKLYRQSGWRIWGAYTSGAYTRYL